MELIFWNNSQLCLTLLPLFIIIKILNKKKLRQIGHFHNALVKVRKYLKLAIRDFVPKIISKYLNSVGTQTNYGCFFNVSINKYGS